MTATRVAVFPCGSEIGLEIRRCLHGVKHFQLVGASSVPDHGEFVYPEYAPVACRADEPGFIDEINRLVRERRIDCLYPAHDEAILRLSVAWADGTLSVPPVAPEVAVCRVCRSKSMTYREFSSLLPTPKIHDPDAAVDMDFPLFVKPDAAQGSRDAHRVDSREELSFYLPRIKDPLVMEYLPGEEYTVDCFTDRRGELLFSSGRTRIRPRAGISMGAAETGDPVFARMAGTINRKLKLRGAWFFQVRRNVGGTPVLLEIAPRIAGTSGFQRGKGVNLPLLTLYDFLGTDVSIVTNAVDVRMDRALADAYRLNLDYDAVYMDLDDTLILSGKVNPEAVAFAFLCLNRGVGVHILTRHDRDPAETLWKHRLAGVFDSVVKVPSGLGKADLIPAGAKAIFIDDSFAERREVAERSGIPVFGPEDFAMLLAAR